MDYIPPKATAAEAIEWLGNHTGQRWTIARIVESGVSPWFWLDYSQEHAIAFGDRIEGYEVQMIFGTDVQRLLKNTSEATCLVTMFRAPAGVFGPDEALVRVPVTVPMDALRFAREDIQALAEPKQQPEDAAPTDNHEAVLAALFDPVRHPQLEKMFPDDGKWADHAERAARNGLDGARTGRGVFNPYLAARWWIDQGPAGWDWSRCAKVLARNLPARSIDSKYLLTGDYD